MQALLHNANITIAGLMSFKAQQIDGHHLKIKQIASCS